MDAAAVKTLLDARISRERAKELLIALVQVRSPQTELLEDEPLLKEFLRTAIEPRLRQMGFSDVRYDAMGNLIATFGEGASGKSLMLIGNAMNQPASAISTGSRCNDGSPSSRAVKPSMSDAGNGHGWLAT